MATEEKLYSDIPPTKLRNKEEKFKPAKTNRFWLTIASLFFFNMLQNRFYAFRYTGLENYTEREKGTPTILFAVKKHQYDGAIIITASHNPKEYNGLKFVTNKALLTNEEQVIKMKKYYELA